MTIIGLDGREIKADFSAPVRDTITNKPDDGFKVELPQEISFEIENKSTAFNQVQEWIKEMMDNFYCEVWSVVEHILRNYVDPPIKGEITAGKIRWRGLALVFADTENGQVFLGVAQRDKIILQNGMKCDFDNDKVKLNFKKFGQR